MEVSTNHFLKFVPFSKFDLWDTKRYTSKLVNSNFEVVKLSSCINEESNKYKLFLEEEKDFGILGVNNKTGIFDAYVQKGKDINQPYKKMEIGWIAYNPYRINVGSIGIRLKEHKNEYISPAYVVFSCKENILPEYLFLVFKTDTFNKVINENTTGSVRQNLSFDKLKDLEIPLPTLQEQQEIVEAYFSKINEANQLKLEANNIDQEIEKYFLNQLGLKELNLKEKVKGLLTVDFKDLDRWDYFSGDYSVISQLKSSNYSLSKLGDIYSFAKRSFNKKTYPSATFKYIEIGAIDPTKGILEAKEIKTEKAPSRATQLIKKGDLILGLTRPYLKKFALVTQEYDENICSSGFSVIEETKDYHLPYLLQFLKSTYGIEQLKNRMTGGLYPAITEGELKEIKIPFPNIDKQIEIMKSVNIKINEIINSKSVVEELIHQANEEFENAIFQ